MKPLALTAILSAIGAAAAAQSPSITPDVLNVSGGTLKQGYYTLEFSVGEATLINTLESAGSSPNFFLTNGFLQPYLYGLKDPAPNPHFTDDEVRILPNPTYGIVEINILTQQRGRVMMYLFDRLGKLKYVRERQSYGFGWVERFDLTGEVNGVYMLKIELRPDDGYQAKKGFYKIIKVGR